MFDGVHLGHQQVIRQTIHDARQHNGLAVAVTFDRHPKSVVAPQRTPALIYTLNQKLRAIEALGVDATLLIEFTPEFSQRRADDFIREIVREFGHVYSVCVGANFVFGHGRTGNVALLKELGNKLGFTVHGLAAVSLDGDIVSSTRVRQMITSGDFDAAGQCLGRAWSLAGKVERGDLIGRKLGFPTANLNITGMAVPPVGVYATRAIAGGTINPAATNIGYRPTLASPIPTLAVETHIIDFHAEIYGQELELFFVQKLRDEQRFPSLDALKEQIARDVLQAKRVLQ